MSTTSLCSRVPYALHETSLFSTVAILITFFPTAFQITCLSVTLLYTMTTSISHWLCTPRCMFAHLNQNFMNNFSLRYIHECGTFDCRYDRCIPFGIFALHFCKTRSFVTLGYDALPSCTEINTISGLFAHISGHGPCKSLI